MTTDDDHPTLTDPHMPASGVWVEAAEQEGEQTE